MSRFDEEPDGDPHGECKTEIASLNTRLAARQADLDDLQSMAHRLALDLECLLLSIDNPAATRWWNEANSTLEAWRTMLAKQRDEAPTVASVMAQAKES